MIRPIEATTCERHFHLNCTYQSSFRILKRLQNVWIFQLIKLISHMHIASLERIAKWPGQWLATQTGTQALVHLRRVSGIQRRFIVCKRSICHRVPKVWWGARVEDALQQTSNVTYGEVCLLHCYWLPPLGAMLQVYWLKKTKRLHVLVKSCRSRPNSRLFFFQT